MFLHSCIELSQLSQEIDQLWVHEAYGTGDNVKFSATKGKTLEILGDLYGESSREFRVVKLTNSPATIAKVVHHIIRRGSQNSPQIDVVNL